ncbi:MAG: EF-hand domain-containing protein [Candidatus Omnitrophica bacterium]|jgi:Ca2+-binding EF-hand superfamily protein|nr:EF-hand domain-containing protein [Candidatus Omnitrophota bacterium]
MKLGKRVIMFFGFILFIFSNVFAQQINPQPVKEQFKSIDENNDKFISSNELQAYQAKKFNELDKDKNGIIDKDELKDDKSKIFGKADKNNDNQISQKEAFKQFNDYFNSMDANGDKKVTEDEFEEYWPINLRL